MAGTLYQGRSSRAADSGACSFNDLEAVLEFALGGDALVVLNSPSFRAFERYTDSIFEVVAFSTSDSLAEIANLNPTSLAVIDNLSRGGIG